MILYMSNGKQVGMNRTQKINLLTNVLQGTTADTARKRLEQALVNAPRSLILIDDFGEPPSPALTDESPVTFQDKGKHYRMSLADARAYAHRYKIRTLIILPAKR